MGALKPKTGWLSRGNGDSPSALMAAVGSVYDAAKYVPIGIVTPLSEVEAIKKRSADDGEFNSRQERLEVIIQLAKTARTSVEVFLSALAQAVDKGMVDGDLLNYHYSDGATQGIDVAVFAERVNDVLGLLASAPEQQVQRNVGRHTTNLKEAVVVWENVRELGELSVGDGKTHMSLLDALALNGALDGFSASYPELRMVRTGPERLHVLEAVQKFLESRGQSGPPSVVKTVYEAMAHEMFKEIAKHELAVPNDALSQVAAGMGIAANEDGAEGASAMDNLVLAQARCGYSVMGVIVPSRAGVNAILAGLAR